ncbi:hypothetical protein DET54_11362 [Paenibacillus pabuli]|uniref:Uncharacterized protein n=1 Tax=Paenibacillus pabuli TaxID=1472 RepID=A0A855YBD5_9BACL|nr:hypothetical protein DET56_107307 [Paenibacillus pabuli]PXW06090.1 hypothetical protein DEU73_107307 [Paenibacillus taichungensis]RAI89779.1 hypothetical protein DET54_11362 [Paenibacillus pabuli]
MECKLNVQILAPSIRGGYLLCVSNETWGKTKYQCAREYVIVPRHFCANIYI